MQQKVRHSIHPLLRDRRVLAGLAQAAFAAVVVFLFAAMLRNMAGELERRGLPLGFAFLNQPARFTISESAIPYSDADSYLRAFLAGIANTLLVSALGIVFATVLGTLIGLGRLSENALVRALSGAYVETIRNVPLLVQLFVWYGVVLLNLPPPRQSLGGFGGIFLNNRGVYFPALEAAEGLRTWGAALIALAASSLAAAWGVNRRRRAGGRPPLSAPFVALLLAGLCIAVTLGWVVAGGGPFRAAYPELEGFNFRGGSRVTPEFAALVAGLSTYTAAFIAEVVRAGVQAVARGQREAAAALGLSHSQALRLVILPQALRVIVPPLVNQYLNLTKNSSLAVAIAFPDLTAVGYTIVNQSGNAVPIMVMLMASYLAISLAISASLNAFNRRTRIAGH